jgi:hypothetical protein
MKFLIGLFFVFITCLTNKIASQNKLTTKRQIINLLDKSIIIMPVSYGQLKKGMDSLKSTFPNLKGNLLFDLI